MILSGPPVKKIATIEQTEIESLIQTIKNEFQSSWVKRSLKIMESSYVLKAKTPTQNDRLNSGEDRLKELCYPLIKPYINENEHIVYLDISCLPPNTLNLIHFDYAWIHVLSRRLTIPLTTNPQAIFATLDESNKILSYNLKVNNVYEINNQTLHAASNFGPLDRWHMVADIIDQKAYQYLSEMNILDKPYANQWCNFHYSEDSKELFRTALKSRPTEII